MPNKLTLGLLLALTPLAVWAQAPTTPPIAPLERVLVEGKGIEPPLADYFKPPQISSPSLSPNGKHLAVATPVRGRLNLAIVDLDTRKGTALTNFDSFDVLGVRWVGNDRLVFSLGQSNSPTGAGQFDGGGLFVVSRDGKESKKLSPTVRETRASGRAVYRGLEYLRSIPGNDNEILAVGNLRTEDADDVYRLDLRTGRSTLVTDDRPPLTSGWILDNKLQPRVVSSRIKDTLNWVIHYRKSVDAPWQEIARNQWAQGPTFAVLSFLSDDKTLLVASNQGRDTMAVYKFDPETGQLGEMLAQHPRYDMGADASGDRVPGIITEPETDRVIGYAVNGDKPELVWTDDKNAKTQATIDAALPGLTNSFRRFPNSQKLLVTSFSDTQPAKWYLLDEEKRTLEDLFSSRPWATPAHYVQQRSFLLKTRDGLEIPSYYFLPKGYKAGDKLPTIVHIHGGPSARADYWGRGFGVLEGQVLASRGYAVVVPNFRVTPGMGARIYYSGFGTVGRQMSEDHEDAAKWAIDQGFADPKRICISGASYGGYATLRALAKTPDLFQCGIAGLVVSDLELQVTSPAGDTAYDPAGAIFWYSLVGQDSRNPNALKDNSPVYMAKQIKAPVLFYAGADDIRTPLEQTNAMVSALKSAGNPPKAVVVKKEEGHGFGKTENNVDLYEQVLKFLEASIGKGPTRP